MTNRVIPIQLSVLSPTLPELSTDICVVIVNSEWGEWVLAGSGDYILWFAKIMPDRTFAWYIEHLQRRFRTTINRKYLPSFSPFIAQVNRCYPFAQLSLSEDVHPQLPAHWMDTPINVAVTGTTLQLKTWQALLEVSFGETLSYQALAQRTDSAKAVRAVASNVGKNPISIVIPCHRIIASDGSLGGYAWGTSLKRQLLNYESTACCHT